MSPQPARLRHCFVVAAVAASFHWHRCCFIVFLSLHFQCCRCNHVAPAISKPLLLPHRRRCCCRSQHDSCVVVLLLPIVTSFCCCLCHLIFLLSLRRCFVAVFVVVVATCCHCRCHCLAVVHRCRRQCHRVVVLAVIAAILLLSSLPCHCHSVVIVTIM